MKRLGHIVAAAILVCISLSAQAQYLQADKLDILGRPNDPELIMAVKTGKVTLPQRSGFHHPYAYTNQNPVNRVDPTGLDWIYSQSSGGLSHQPPASQGGGPPQPVGEGYAGNGDGYNNPNAQGTPNVGPIPQGTYDIGSPYDSAKTGPYTLPLIPTPGTNTQGRGDFRIHGDNECRCGSASEGCIVLDKPYREMINNSGDPILVVVP